MNKFYYKFIFILFLLLSLYGCPPQTESTITDDWGFIYQDLENEDGYAVFIDNLLINEVIDVPSSFQGKPVLQIGMLESQAGYANGTVKTIILPDTLKYIGAYAFAHLSNLEGIDIPSSVVSIGPYAFRNNTSITSIEIPALVTEVSEGLFDGCTNLTSIAFSGDISNIGVNAFRNDSNIEDILFVENGKFIYKDYLVLSQDETILYAFISSYPEKDYSIPNHIEIISTGAFAYNSTIENLIIGSDVKTIYPFAFQHMYLLKSVEISEVVEEIKDYAFYLCESLETITLNEGLLIIGDNAFWGENKVIEVIIPSTVYHIGDYAFGYNNSLERILVNGLNQYYQSIDGVLFESNGTILHTYPSGKVDEIYTTPSSVILIKQSAFESNTFLREVYISEGTTYISENAFAYCFFLEKIVIPSTVEYIGNGAFWGYSEATIYVALDKEPDSWQQGWNLGDLEVVWDY